MVPPDVKVYSIGLCNCSVCASRETSREDVKKETNLMHPTGISSQWRISRKKFSGGELNPCPCNEHPNDRLHYLMVC